MLRYNSDQDDDELPLDGALCGGILLMICRVLYYYLCGCIACKYLMYLCRNLAITFIAL